MAATTEELTKSGSLGSVSLWDATGSPSSFSPIYFTDKLLSAIHMRAGGRAGSCLHTALPSHAPTLAPSSSHPALSIPDGNEPCWVTQTHRAQKMSQVWPLPSSAGFLSIWRWLLIRINDRMHREQHQWAQRNSGQTQKTTKPCGNDLRMSLGNLMIIVLFYMYWVWKADNCSRVPVEIRRPFVLVSKETNIIFHSLQEQRQHHLSTRQCLFLWDSSKTMAFYQWWIWSVVSTGLKPKWR